MRYKAVIFDMDGTLIDSLEGIGDAANKVLSELGVEEHPIEQYRFFVGEGARRLVEKILPQDQQDEGLIQQCLAKFLDEYERSWNQKSRLYEGIPELLDELSDRGVAMSILSNKPHDFTRAFAERYLDRWRFDQILGSSKEIPPKPNSQGVMRVLDQFGISSKECLFVGDSKIDMQTAVNSSIKPVGVLWGFRSREELEAHGACWLIEKPEQLLNIIKSGNDQI